jgi:endonuclease G
VLIDVESGSALDLHFAGIYLKNNYAVGASELRRLLGRLGRVPEVATTVSRRVAVEASPPVAASVLDGRTGFDPAFLGPSVTSRCRPCAQRHGRMSSTFAQRLEGRSGICSGMNTFSIAMNRERKMALFTAVNIDGAQEQRLKRAGDPWSKDPRIPGDAQIGNELYANNELDRGHLVRRLDPTWGATAPTAERDTFFFTNCTSQHAQFNQRLWVELEDYLLDSADTLGFRASVVSGPVFDKADGAYRGVRLPNANWKVAVMLRTDDGSLSATGYVVSQADLVSNLEFAYGQVRMYQVVLTKVEELTGLDFGALRAYDPLGALESVGIQQLTQPQDTQV